MRRLALLLAAGLLAAGCGSNSQRAYYRARSLPQDVDASYGSIERARWKGDPTVYELPGPPPSLGEEHLERRYCRLPGPQFKPQTIVGMHEGTAGAGGAEQVTVGGQDTLGRHRGPDTRTPEPVGLLRNDPGPGVGFDAQWQQVAGPDRRPVPKASADVHPGTPIGGQRDMEKTDYCLPDALPPAPTAQRLPVTTR